MLINLYLKTSKHQNYLHIYNQFFNFIQFHYLLIQNQFNQITYYHQIIFMCFINLSMYLILFKNFHIHLHHHLRIMIYTLI